MLGLARGAARYQEGPTPLGARAPNYSRRETEGLDHSGVPRPCCSDRGGWSVASGTMTRSALLPVALRRGAVCAHAATSATSAPVSRAMRAAIDRPCPAPVLQHVAFRTGRHFHRGDRCRPRLHTVLRWSCPAFCPSGAQGRFRRVSRHFHHGRRMVEFQLAARAPRQRERADSEWRAASCVAPFPPSRLSATPGDCAGWTPFCSWLLAHPAAPALDHWGVRS